MRGKNFDTTTTGSTEKKVVWMCLQRQQEGCMMVLSNKEGKTNGRKGCY
jgi:hypothetical protein